MVIWAISSSESQETLESFRDALGLTFPVLMDSSGDVQGRYRVSPDVRNAAYPQEFIVDPDGYIAYVNNAYEPDEIAAVFDELLAE